ncbi:hypothetical protein H8356DRAFT_1393187 [Neocallimastix lanati (nom. inval.)]|uniref:Uncharacterized protein n=1 Tax=Neocallimastix californiae TaxID=1754190 RepID=A0A1Y2ESE6_9FUNG|nr:hypothetical protein H8356DRAFT_1393187 [Neocallimastix sp. JGI-2020a]ORY73775.1 hypothetical protein LY90DRAFT_502960 [Neocallimastix californiae]|eukprot:ORY73775.1 hypothetical protein LY90DRAFT_502960 [Neocallimastix californiae]
MESKNNLFSGIPLQRERNGLQLQEIQGHDLFVLNGRANPQEDPRVFNGLLNPHEDGHVQAEQNYQFRDIFPYFLNNHREPDVKRDAIEMQREIGLLNNLINVVLMEKRELENTNLRIRCINNHIQSQLYLINQIENQRNFPYQNEIG